MTCEYQPTRVLLRMAQSGLARLTFRYTQFIRQVTPALLERLKNYARTATIREPIRVWMPVDRAQQLASH